MKKTFLSGFWYSLFIRSSKFFHLLSLLSCLVVLVVMNLFGDSPKELGCSVNSESSDFDKFYLANYQKLYRLVSYGIPVQQDIQNIVQDAFLEFYEVYQDLPKEEWLTWIYNKARNKRRAFVRGEKRRSLRDVLFLQGFFRFRGDDVEGRFENRELIRKALSQLPEDKVFLLELHYLSSMSSSEIAAILNVESSSIPKLLQRARQYFCRAFQSLNEGD